MEYILFNRIALIRYVNYLVESLKSCSQKEKNKAEVINMPRIAIVDDQEEYLEEICNLIEKFYFKNGIPYVVNTFSNAQLLLYEMEEKLYFDIYLLDIEMPGINGLSLAEKIRSMDDAGYIVFITSHLKFLINGYDYFAYQFIPKNNLKKKLISTLESLQKRLDIEDQEIILKGTTKEIFKRMSEYSFIQEMNSSANVCTKIIFKKPRIIRYGIEVKNIGYWESERVFIPEKNVIITQRKEPMGPFKYLVVIYVLEKDNQGTKFTYIEEFDVCDNYQNEVEKIYSDISKKVNPILQKITDYFNLEHILQ